MNRWLQAETRDLERHSDFYDRKIERSDLADCPRDRHRYTGDWNDVLFV